MVWLIELLVLSMTVVLMYHAERANNLQFVKLFWFSGLIMGVLRELILAQVGGLYAYGAFNLTIFGMPVIFTVLWTNLSYVSWQWSDNYLGREYLSAQKWDHHLPLMFVTMVLIAFFFESLLSQYQLIHWKLGSFKTLWGGTPLLAPFAYGFTTVLYMQSLRWIIHRFENNWQSTTLQLAALQPLVVLVLMGLLFITNLIIILVYS